MSNYSWYYLGQWIFKCGDEFLTDLDNKTHNSLDFAKLYIDLKKNPIKKPTKNVDKVF